MSLQLRKLTEKDENAFFLGMKESESQPLYWYSFFVGAKYDVFGYAVATRKGKIGKGIGDGSRSSHNVICIRRGGNIGYAVAPRFRRQGFAHEIVRQGIEYCREIGLSSIMVSCADENIASWKIIERFHGVLEDKVWDEETKENIRRYWIQL